MNGVALQQGIFSEFSLLYKVSSPMNLQQHKGEPKLTVKRKGFELANRGLLTEEATALTLIQFT